jgi:hypothetical protein
MIEHFGASSATVGALKSLSAGATQKATSGGKLVAATRCPV